MWTYQNHRTPISLINTMTESLRIIIARPWCNFRTVSHQQLLLSNITKNFKGQKIKKVVCKPDYRLYSVGSSAEWVLNKLWTPCCAVLSPDPSWSCGCGLILFVLVLPQCCTQKESEHREGSFYWFPPDAVLLPVVKVISALGVSVPGFICPFNCTSVPWFSPSATAQ